jgi:Co/Zn/Cd efflux system component
MNPDNRVTADVRRTVEQDGDRLTDLHVWRLGPGHLGAIVCLETDSGHGPDFYRERLRDIPTLSHVTVEVQRAA